MAGSPEESPYERARAAWPELHVDEDRFAAACAAAGVPQAELYPADLWLVLACERGDPNALRALERVVAPIAKEVADRARTKLESDDLAQLLWQRLLIAEEGRVAKLFEYSGKGPLQGWLRVVATRLLVDAARKRSGNEAPVSNERVLDGLFAAASDPETELLKRHSRAALAAAFADALAALSPEDRTILRQHLADQLTIDQIAAAHGTHRATAARWINRAKETLVQGTRRRLGERLGLGRDELESVMRLIESQLHVSVVRLLVG
jgi:RNA polymerase sigma-70 factor (ECF subfamily)